MNLESLRPPHPHQVLEPPKWHLTRPRHKLDEQRELLLRERVQRVPEPLQEVDESSVKCPQCEGVRCQMSGVSQVSGIEYHCENIHMSV